MREAVFLKNNAEKWSEIEKMLQNKSSVPPDTLSDLFIELNDDLAYAQTNYPKSKITKYLNTLTAETYQSIYGQKKEQMSRFARFWIYELPVEVRKAHKTLLLTFLFFFLIFIMSSVSQYHDEEYAYTFLGEPYIEMTKENIESGDPMAVYKSHGAVEGFLGITLNNLKVSILTFSMGIFFGIGTYFILISNGAMLGSFLTYFFMQGLIEDTATIWIHGTIEISCIVIAGAAGIVMGNGYLYPKTHSRVHSLIQSGKTGIKILIGILPLIIIAGFLESSITRFTFMPFALKMGIIILSLACLIFYFILYPIFLERKGRQYDIDFSIHEPTIRLQNIFFGYIWLSIGMMFTFALYFNEAPFAITIISVGLPLLGLYKLAIGYTRFTKSAISR